MKAFKVYIQDKTITGYGVIHDDGGRRNDLQAMMSVLHSAFAPKVEWLVLDIGRLDVNKLK